MKIRATTFRTILIVTLVVIIVAGGAGFYFAYDWVKGYATEVNTTVTSAHASESPLASASAKAIQATLTQQAPAIATLATFYASPTDFQAKAIEDIDTYATKSGLSVGDVTLGGTAAATATTTPATPAATTTASDTSVTVKLNAPVSYTSLLKFITYIQSSLPKMKIESLTLTRLANGTPDSVSIDTLVISVVTQ